MTRLIDFIFAMTLIMTVVSVIGVIAALIERRHRQKELIRESPKPDTRDWQRRHQEELDLWLRE